MACRILPQPSHSESGPTDPRVRRRAGAKGNSSGWWKPGGDDDSGAVRAAMAMARACGGVAVFFPKGGYAFKSTVSVLDGADIVG